LVSSVREVDAYVPGEEMLRNERNCWIVWLAFVAVACSGSSPERPTATEVEAPKPDAAAAGSDPGSVDRSARVLPLPGQELPPGHPSTANTAQRALEWVVPDGWIEVPPASSMRIAEYRIPGPAGDGSLAVFYFGPGQGGDPMANAVRWAQQFEQPDGSSSVDRMEITEIASQVPVRLVEVTGIYDGGMTMTAAPSEKQPGWMLLGAIAQGADAPWFFKLTGPEQTVRASRAGMIEMMESLRNGG